MLTLIFEVHPKSGHADHYFNRAAALKPFLEKYDGLLHLERYTQIANPEIVLSHQYWRDEAALIAWREDANHRKAQMAGYDRHFEDYRIRVGDVLVHRVDHDVFEKRIEAVDPGTDRIVAIFEGDGEVRAPDSNRFTSVTREGAMIAVYAPETGADLEACAGSFADAKVKRTLVRITRDYTKTKRHEAPQEF